MKNQNPLEVVFMVDENITCVRCGRVIGKLIKVDNQDWLWVNGVVVTVMRGVCDCGEEFHWSISERMLAKLINRVKQC